MTRTRTAVLVASAALGLVLLPGCSLAGTPAGNPAGAPAGNANTGGPGTSVSLAAENLRDLGPVVTDGNGMTLYRFDNDSNKPSASNCNDGCAAKWPPVLTTSDDVELQGVDKALVGFVTRQDGTRQVTLNGWPLYQFAQDKAPGQAKGQGADGIWYAATPEGKKAGGATDSDGYRY